MLIYAIVCLAVPVLIWLLPQLLSMVLKKRLGQAVGEDSFNHDFRLNTNTDTKETSESTNNVTTSKADLIDKANTDKSCTDKAAIGRASIDETLSNERAVEHSNVMVQNLYRVFVMSMLCLLVMIVVCLMLTMVWALVGDAIQQDAWLIGLMLVLPVLVLFRYVYSGLGMACPEQHIKK